MSDRITCTQCGGKGCEWCNYTGWMSEDRYRECAEETRKANDDRNLMRDRDRRSGAYFG